MVSIRTYEKPDGSTANVYHKIGEALVWEKNMTMELHSIPMDWDGKALLFYRDDKKDGDKKSSKSEKSSDNDDRAPDLPPDDLPF